MEIVIKQIHNQLCLLAGKRVVLLEQTSSTPPAPPGRLAGLLLKVLKDGLRQKECKGKLTSPSSRFFQHNFTINIQGLFNTLISYSCFIENLRILLFNVGYIRGHQLFKFHSTCKVRTVPSGIILQKYSDLSAGIQNLISLVPFYRHNIFHTPITSKRLGRLHEFNHLSSLESNPLIGFNIKPCHLN